jgi:hypothetical protein
VAGGADFVKRLLRSRNTAQQQKQGDCHS